MKPVGLKTDDNLVVPDRWPHVTASCKQQRLSYSRLFRTLKAIALWAVTGQLPARCHGARSGYVRQVPKEFAHITLQGLHVEGRGVHVGGSHRDRGTENKREQVMQRDFARGPRFSRLLSK